MKLTYLNRQSLSKRKRKGIKIKPNVALYLFFATMGILLFLSTKLMMILHQSQNSIDVESTKKITMKVSESDRSTQVTSQKPKLILHVGPRKTATTSIQLSVLSLRNNEYSPFLKEDDYEIVNSNWSDVISIIENCFLQLPKNCSTIEWDRMVAQLDEIYDKGKNAIITNEAFSLVPKTNEVREMFHSLEDKWNVTVIMVYRPYETWLPSIYRELRAQGMMAMGSKAWRRFTYHLSYDVSFVEFFERSWMKNSDAISNFHQKDEQKELVGRGEIEGLQLGDPLETKELYDYIFGPANVITFDLIEQANKKRDIVERFTCEGLKAANTCKFIQSRKRSPKRRRQGLIYDFEEDLIVMTAYRQNITKQMNLARWGQIGCLRVERDPARRKLKKFMEEKNMKMEDFPKKCVTDESSQKIKERSWKMENGLSSNPRTKQQFDSDFERERINFCSVDAEKVLQKEEIKNFLASRSFNRNCDDEQLTAKKCHYYSSMEYDPKDPDSKSKYLIKEECKDQELQALMSKFPVA